MAFALVFLEASYRQHQFNLSHELSLAVPLFEEVAENVFAGFRKDFTDC